MFGWLHSLWAARTRPKAKPVVVSPPHPTGALDPIEKLMRIVGVTPEAEPPLKRQRPPFAVRGQARRRSR